MSDEHLNPYASPATFLIDERSQEALGISKKDLLKIHAILTDGELFWFVIAFGLICLGPAVFILVPWYFVRRLQWNDMSIKYPTLLNADVPAKSVQHRFQRVQIKLKIGMIAGLVYAAAILCILAVRFVLVGPSQH